VWRPDSVYGRSQVRGGTVADMSGLRAVHRVDDDRVTVDAGATWRDVLGATLPRGLKPPVLTDYLDLSVGGTLAVGGVGGTTLRHGVQSDYVLEMQVVTGRGEVLTCSPTRLPELFDAVRAGFGQVAVITRATLRLVAAPRQARHFLLFHHDLTTMLADARLLAAGRRFDVQGAVIPHRPVGGRSGSTWPPTSRTTYRRMRSCSPACPTTAAAGRPARCRTSATSPGSMRWNGRCAPPTGGASRTRG